MEAKNNQKNNIAVYTAIFGNYDPPPSVPLGFQDQEVDFICFSDVKINCPKPWENIIINSFSYSAAELSRCVKFVAHQYLSGYDIIVYVDGNVVINSLALNIIKILDEKIQCVFIAHPERQTVLSECIACVIYKGLSIKEAMGHIHKLAIYGYHDQLKLTANRFFARKINQATNKLFEDVFSDYCNGPKRDQLHLQFQLWRHSLSHCIISNEQVEDMLIVKNHNKYNKMIRRIVLLINRLAMWAPVFALLKISLYAGMLKGKK